MNMSSKKFGILLYEYVCDFIFRRRIFLSLSFIAVLMLAPNVQARPVHFVVQPAVNQTSTFNQGQQIVSSEGVATSVQMLVPNPSDDERIQIHFVFVNRSGQPLNVGPENVSATQISLIAYDTLMAEQRRREGWRAFGAALEIVGNSLSATQAGRSQSTFNYGGSAIGNRGQATRFYGSGSVTTYDPYAAAQAQALARAQNEAVAAQLRFSNANSRELIDFNLRTTTVGFGQVLPGMFTFEIPRDARRSRVSLPFSVTVQFGSETHTFSGYLGPVGAAVPTAPTRGSARPQPAAFTSSTQQGIVSIVQQTGNAGTHYASQNFSADNEYNLGYQSYLARNFDNALFHYRRSAQMGFAAAQNDIGTMYQRGLGVPNDFDEAARLYRLAADQGFSAAQSNLGLLYVNGQGVPQDDNEAVRWFRLASDQGFPNAQTALGLMYEYGQGVTQDYAEAARLYRLAAEQGFAAAQERLGTLHLNGQGVAQNDVEAARLLQLAADQGIASAQATVASMFATGTGLEQNDAEAARYARLAAEQGNAKAQRDLGVLYRNGRGVPRDYSEAVRLFILSAEQGNVQARINLANAYYIGEGVSKDYIKSYMWYRLAASEGVAGTEFLSRLMSREDIARAQQLSDACRASQYRGC